MLRVCRLVYRKNSLVASDFVYLLSFSALAYPCRKSFRRPPRVYMARLRTCAGDRFAKIVIFPNFVNEKT